MKCASSCGRCLDYRHDPVGRADMTPSAARDQYGIKDVKQANFARNCLVARRLIERGVRFVQLFHEAWYQHGDLTKAIKKNSEDTDQASAALVKDLKQRGLLDDTLVVWGGEFGRTPSIISPQPVHLA